MVTSGPLAQCLLLLIKETDLTVALPKRPPRSALGIWRCAGALLLMASTQLDLIWRHRDNKACRIPLRQQQITAACTCLKMRRSPGLSV
jgi:hypothetical protein